VRDIGTPTPSHVRFVTNDYKSLYGARRGWQRRIRFLQVFVHAPEIIRQGWRGQIDKTQDQKRRIGNA
jgi:hypothetical protein